MVTRVTPNPAIAHSENRVYRLKETSGIEVGIKMPDLTDSGVINSVRSNLPNEFFPHSAFRCFVKQKPRDFDPSLPHFTETLHGHRRWREQWLAGQGGRVVSK